MSRNYRVTVIRVDNISKASGVWKYVRTGSQDFLGEDGLCVENFPD
jgi:hypothetical protein